MGMREPNQDGSEPLGARTGAIEPLEASRDAVEPPEAGDGAAGQLGAGRAASGPHGVRAGTPYPPEPRIAPGVSPVSAPGGAAGTASWRRRSRIVAACVAAFSIVLIGVSSYFLLSAPQSAVDAVDAGQDAQQGTSQGTAAAEAQAGESQDPQAQDAGAFAADAGDSAADGAAASSGGSSSDGAGALASSGVSDASGGGSSGSSQHQPSVSAVSVTVSVSSSAAGGSVSGGGNPTFAYGATAYDALCATGLSVNAAASQYGVYVTAIGGLAEKEHGANSGWMYSVNGQVPSVSCSSYVLQDGDSVAWYYVV